MSDLRLYHYYLGMSIRRDKPQQGIFLGQPGYIEQTLRDYGMWDTKSVVTPMDSNKLEPP